MICVKFGVGIIYNILTNEVVFCEKRLSDIHVYVQYFLNDLGGALYRVARNVRHVSDF
jgi:hypothetical protein